jgi:DNA-binding transcriptional LysR family regulator
VASGSLSLAALTPLIDGFRQLYPKVNVRLTLSERHVDLVEDGFDVGIVTAFMVSSTALVERPVATNTLIPVATPEYLAEHGSPETPSDLLHHSFVALPSEMRSATWHFRHRHNGSADQVTLSPIYTVNSALMVRLGTLAHMGISIIPEGIVAADLEEGTLVRVLSDFAIDDPDVKVSIVYPGRQYLPAKTRAFIDYTLEHMGPGGEVGMPKPESILSRLQMVVPPSSAAN